MHFRVRSPGWAGDCVDQACVRKCCPSELIELLTRRARACVYARTREPIWRTLKSRVCPLTRVPTVLTNKSGFPRGLACAQQICGESAALRSTNGRRFAGARGFCLLPLLAYNSVVRWPRCYAAGPGKRARFYYAFYIPRSGFLGFRAGRERDFGGLLVTRIDEPNDGQPFRCSLRRRTVLSAVTSSAPLGSPPGRQARGRTRAESGAAKGAQLHAIRRVARRGRE